MTLLTATTAERFFRVDQAQEQLHFATDIFSDDLFIVYPESEAMSLDMTVLRDPDDLQPSAKNPKTAVIFGHRHLCRINAKRPVNSKSKSAP